MQFEQVLDNAEVVTPFAAKLSVAQQARNGELRSCTCLAWLKPIYEAGNSLAELQFCHRGTTHPLTNIRKSKSRQFRALMGRHGHF